MFRSICRAWLLNLILFVKTRLKRLITLYKHGFNLDGGQLYRRVVNLRDTVDYCFVIVSHEREVITAEVVRNIVELAKNQFSLAVTLVVSPGEASKIEKALDTSTLKRVSIVECVNLPLGNKWQVAVDCARDTNPGAIVICGSDDFISRDFIDELGSLKNQRFSVAGLNQWHIFDLSEMGGLYLARYTDKSLNGLLGAGRVISRTFLERIGWRVFDRRINSGLDHKVYAKARSLDPGSIKYLETSGIISVKGSWSMLNSASAMKSSSTVSVTKAAYELHDIDREVAEIISDKFCH